MGLGVVKIYAENGNQTLCGVSIVWVEKLSVREKTSKDKNRLQTEEGTP